MPGRTKLVTDNQELKSLKIETLRGIKDLDISFEGSPVTGIFGLNGSGKTTILQTIVCLFRAKNVEENTKMSRFFKYTSAANKWVGSKYSAVVDYFQLSGRRRAQIIDKQIQYGKPASEWTPRQISKPDRNVVYVPLSDSIPDIERASEKKVTFRPEAGEALDLQIANAATQIMGISYSDLKVNKTDKINCFTVKRKGIECHSFNLGAGEQKVFRILQILYRVPHHSLIVIDELDLTLHTAALRELIKIMIFEASKPERQLQIVFTSHRQELMKNAAYNVRYILNTPAKTFCLDNPTEDCYEQLSGDPEKYLKVYVEDDVAEAIIVRCMQESGMSKHYQVCRFGSVTNAVRLALGLSCQYDDLRLIEDTVFFGDGDVKEFTQERWINLQIERTLSGGEHFLEERREKAKHLIKHLNPPEIGGKPQHPEEFIHSALGTIDIAQCKFPEIVNDSNAIIAVVDHHEYVNKLTDVGHSLRDIISLVASTQGWNDYVQDVKSWIESRKVAHGVGII